MSNETPRERLARRLVQQPNGCLVWTGYVLPTGYGQVWVNGKLVRVHRLAWSLANNQPVPDGRHILHSCDNRPCCEPTHLRPGTNVDNGADMTARGRSYQQKKTHCPQGHEYTEANTYKSLTRVSRHCRQCRRKED